MITINLVPVKERKKRKDILIIFSVASVFLFIVLIMAYIYLQRLSVASNLNKQIDDVKKESEGYQDKINEVKEFENKQASVDSFKKTITGISETQRKILVAFDQMGVNLPDGVWLTGITQGSGKDENVFSIQGYSFTEESLQTYCSNLQRPAGLLKDVAVDEKTSVVAVGTARNKIHKFQINFRVMDQGT